MSIVAVNTKYVSLPELSDRDYLKVGYKGEFKIESSDRALPIQQGNNLVFLKPQKSDLVFTNSAIIRKIGRRETIPRKPAEKGQPVAEDHKEKYYHYFDFEIQKALEKNNLLSELEYSLPVIENYHKPEKHFQKQYRTLESNDYETIVNGWVYATRTVFGNLVNALPRQNKLEFMIQAMDHFSTIDFKDISLLQGLNFLYQYIDRRILSRGRLLVATNKIIHSSFSQALPPRETGFIDPDTNVIFNIKDQAEIFENLFDLEKEKSIKTLLEETLKTNQEMESRFEKLFKRRSWPVDLQK